MGFGSYFGGLVLCVLAVLLAFFGLVVLLGFFTIVASSYNVPFGIGMLVVASHLVPIWMVFIQIGKTTRNIKRPQPIKIPIELMII